MPSNPGFRRRTQLVNALLGSWPIVAGTGSWLEAHLVARLALATELPRLCGCGINPQQVWSLMCQQYEQEAVPLVLLTDSIAADQGHDLIRRLRRNDR